MKISRFVSIILSVLMVMTESFARAADKPIKPLVVRVGHFPNLTHSQALVAHYMSRQGHGWFEQRLGTNVEIQWFIYNAGPSAMEAMFARSLDLSYVGPNPAINAYMRSHGKEVRIIAGAAQGGAALVVQPDIKSAADLRGKSIATPQFGNTQDVACRVWLKQQGFHVTMTGGDVRVVPTPNPDQFDLFTTKGIAGAWTVEPWVSRLEMDAGGRIFLSEDEAITTLLAARASFLHEHRELVRKFAAAHAELTRWINEHPQEAQKMVLAELAAETHREFPQKILQRSWQRLHFTADVSPESLKNLVAAAQQVGFLKKGISVDHLVEIP